MKFMSNEKRYQECNPLEKLWRMRHYLKVPFIWLDWKLNRHELNDGKYLNNKTEIGRAHV